MTTSTPVARWRRPVWIALPAIAAGAAAAYVYASASTTAPATRPADARAVPVSLAKTTTQDLPIWINAIGTVTSFNAVSVRSRVDGQLERVLFDEGRAVKRGELLALIDPRPLQAQVNQAQAVVAQEEAKLASNKVDLQRATELATAGAGPTQTVDTLHAQVTTQGAVVQAAHAALDNAQLQLAFTRITSPIDGRVGQRLVPAGSMVHAADAGGIVTVTQMHPIWVTFSVPQDELPLILDQSHARKLLVQALQRDQTRTLADGELEFVDSQVTPTVGQITLKARFDNAERNLWPGELVAVRMLVRTQPKATVIPQEAVQQGPSGSFVYVVDGQRMAQARTVDAAAISRGMQWIRSGLRPGETVVTQGQYRIAPGVPVTGIPAAAPATASAASAVKGA